MAENATVKKILSQFLSDYYRGHTLTPRQSQVCSHIETCRTAALGGLNLHCDHCDYEQPQFHSCRDRHCPCCQSGASMAWCDKQLENILPVTYFHLVFTLPHDLNGWAQLHPELIYNLMFQVVWETLQAFGHDPRRLDGDLGMTAVLHTWGQTLTQHIHLHCIVPGGALSKDGQLNPAKSNYLFPVKALSRGFRGRMVSALRKAALSGELDLVTRPGEVDDLLEHLMSIDWVVYGKSCLSHTKTVIEYLARYTHKTAIGDWRILEVDDKNVRFSYKDYTDNNRIKEMTLTGVEFIRRFLLHVLPKGLMRIRHYGWLANRFRKEKLKHIRAVLKVVT